MPFPLTLPLELQIPLGGLLLAVLSWVGLEVVGRRCRARSLLRGLLLTSRLSVALTCLLAGLGWWLGLLLDPVYSGKGMAGLVDLVRKGFFEKGQNVVFLHTGCAAGLFAYRRELLGAEGA